MSGINDKLINYEGLSTFYDDLKQNDLAAKQDVLSAGDNISIQNGAISAKGYKFDDEKKEELKLIDDILHAAGMPLSLGLTVSGAAGATTYTWTDAMGGAFAQVIQMGMLPGVGATYQTANGKSGVITAIDATTITFEETLDADNALANEPVDYVVTTTQLFSFAEGMYDYVEGDISTFGITLSGAAGATTYIYTGIDMRLSIIPLGSILKLQDGRSAKLVSVDETNKTASFESTFDADNALNNELIAACSNKNYASGNYSHAEGGYELLGVVLSNIASGRGSHAEGGGTTASGQGSHAEGGRTTASGQGSHAEGLETTASGDFSHAEGGGAGAVITASGRGSHAEGGGTTASGDYSHAEGNGTTASGAQSHTEGYQTTTSNYNAHAEGNNTAAGGHSSHAEGAQTTTQNYTEHAEGNFNVSHKASDSYGNAGNTQHSIGVSNNSNARKNAFEIMQNGDVYITGVGGYQGTNTKVQDATIKTLQEYIAALEARIAALEHPQTTE